MKLIARIRAGIVFTASLAGCSTQAPQAGVGPGGTVPYDILVTANGVGARITVNGQSMGNTPLRLKVFGDKDRTFHDYGSYSFLVTAYPLGSKFPLGSEEFVQSRVFATNRDPSGGDLIPEAIHFDLFRAPLVKVKPYSPTQGWESPASDSGVFGHNIP